MIIETNPKPEPIKELELDFEAYCNESRTQIVQRFKEKTTFYLDGILFRIHKLIRKGMEIRPIQGVPRHKPKTGKNPLSLPLPGERCPLCGVKVSEGKR